jgi:hypothetical protein
MPSVIPARENHENKTFFTFYNTLSRNGFLSLVVHPWWLVRTFSQDRSHGGIFVVAWGVKR